MSYLDDLLERNRIFADQQQADGTLIPTLSQAMITVKAMIIGCADMRVDPFELLRLAPGEAVVLRNIGGRVTPGLLEEISLLGRVGQIAGEAPAAGGEFHLIVLHHTDCGILRLARHPASLAHYFQIPEAELQAKAVLDPYEAVKLDVDRLRAVPTLPAAWLLSGLVYDVTTGRIEIVAPAAPLRPS